MPTTFRSPRLALAAGAALALGLGVGQATAADAPSWGGLYLGVTAGAQHTTTHYALPGDTADALQSDHAGKSTASFGGLVGFERQTNDIVLGLEADVMGGTNRQGVTACTVPDGCWSPAHDSFTTLNRFKEGPNGRVRVRAGIADGATLFYVAGGYSVAKTRLDLVGECFNPGDPSTPLLFNFSRSKTISGFNLGAGIERRIGERISLRAEYVYDDFGHQLYRGDGVEWNDRRIGVHNSDLRAAAIYRF
jgi:outer membrane immunogenic protein